MADKVAMHKSRYGAYEKKAQEPTMCGKRVKWNLVWVRWKFVTCKECLKRRNRG